MACHKDMERHAGVLHGHLTQAPEDFFQDTLTQGNFLVPCLAVGRVSFCMHKDPVQSLVEVCSDAKQTKRLQRRAKLIEVLGTCCCTWWDHVAACAGFN